MNIIYSSPTKIKIFIFLFIVTIAMILLSSFFSKDLSNIEEEKTILLGMEVGTESIKVVAVDNSDSLKKTLDNKSISIPPVGNMKPNKKDAKKIWNKLSAINFDQNESEELLYRLMSAGAGWVLYDEIIHKISEGEISDSVAVMLIDILTDAYEGGKLDKETYYLATNEKDQKIQDLLRSQLNTPIGKKSLLTSMDLIFYLVPDGDISSLLEDTIEINKELLSDNEKLRYRLHYAGGDGTDNVTSIINNLNASNNIHKPGYYNSEFFRGLSKYIGDGYNDLQDEASQTAVRTYLDNNPVQVKTSSDILDYGTWLRMYTATTGEKNLEKSLYEQVVQTEDPVKVLAILDNLSFESETPDSKSSVYLKKMIENDLIRKKLEESLLENDLSGDIKSKIKFSLRFFSNHPENQNDKEVVQLEDAVLTMSTKDKERFKPQLENLLKDNSLTQEEIQKIQEILDSNF